jgi:hypothetical protein
MSHDLHLVIKSYVSDSHVKVPHNWDITFSALDAGVNLVKSSNKRPIKVGPMSVLAVSGICKSLYHQHTQ